MSAWHTGQIDDVVSMPQVHRIPPTGFPPLALMFQSLMLFSPPPLPPHSVTQRPPLLIWAGPFLAVSLFLRSVFSVPCIGP